MRTDKLMQEVAPLLYDLMTGKVPETSERSELDGYINAEIVPMGCPKIKEDEHIKESFIRVEEFLRGKG